MTYLIVIKKYTEWNILKDKLASAHWLTNCITVTPFLTLLPKPSLSFLYYNSCCLATDTDISAER